MTLAPIRGAPPGAPISDFPIERPRANPAEPRATPDSDDRPPICSARQRHTPIEIGDSGVTLAFRVIPELPAIAAASMTIHIVADARQVGFLRMSAPNARAFLTDLRNGCYPIVATGDEDGTAQIDFEIAQAELVLSVRKPGQGHTLHRWVIDHKHLETTADELLADLGA